MYPDDHGDWRANSGSTGIFVIFVGFGILNVPGTVVPYWGSNKLSIKLAFRKQDKAYEGRGTKEEVYVEITCMHTTKTEICTPRKRKAKCFPRMLARLIHYSEHVCPQD